WEVTRTASSRGAKGRSGARDRMIGAEQVGGIDRSLDPAETVVRARLEKRGRVDGPLMEVHVGAGPVPGGERLVQQVEMRLDTGGHLGRHRDPDGKGDEGRIEGSDRSAALDAARDGAAEVAHLEREEGRADADLDHPAHRLGPE